MPVEHYLDRPETLPPDRFAAWSREVHAVIASLPPGMIRGEWGEGDPVLTDELVMFNGNAHYATLHEDDPIAIYHDPDRLATYPEINNWERDSAYPLRVARVFAKYNRSVTAEGWLWDTFITRNRPYEYVVVAALILFAHHFAGMCRVRSDRSYEEWRPGLALAQGVTGLALYIPFYSRGWSRPRILPPDVFRMWRDDVVWVITEAGVPLAGPEGTGEPILPDDLVAFNGVGDAGEEPLRISRAYDPADGGFGMGSDEYLMGFIRTMGNAGKRYDVVVAAALLLLADRMPLRMTRIEDDRLVSEGVGVQYGGMADEEWRPAMELAIKATGRTFDRPPGWS